MSALAQEACCDRGLDEVLWQARKAMDLPEGYRAEIIEAAIEVLPPGRRRHDVLAHRLRGALDARLAGSGFQVHQDIDVVHGRKVCAPCLFVASEDLAAIRDKEGCGVDATRVSLVAGVVAPGADAHSRDERRRRYALAGIPVYVVIDDFTDEGTVTVFSSPDPDKGTYATKTTVSYGTPVTVPEGPAKGLVIGEEVTRP
ncbi:Uma2 family endonuclease [Streptomyces sp. CJ_13]|uniref:Uma2 family endonuclease n=1 Tax=Streptomyces TaxID=1883 RepID=UPI001BDCF8AB|nr:Uma2 family endonuclease [Streptomyces sp. CJ_13]MBT1185058.1 Uma2 family endonuclease [Streptomyces sp. CJ_13]